MRDTKVTIKDVAEAAGVSIAAVSNALNGTGRLSEQTRQAIQEVAQRLKFRPNLMAQALIKKRTLTIGLLTDDTYGRFSFPVMAGISDALVDHGVSVLLAAVEEDPERARLHVNALLERRVDGLIVSGRRADRHIPLDLSDADVPVVYALTASPSGSPNITVDDQDGARMGADWLLKTGRRDIVHVTGPESHLAARHRAAGYREAIGKPGRVMHGQWAERWGRQAVAELWSGASPPPDGITCGSDQIARGVIDELRERGIKVPEQVGVVGFDNWQIVADATLPPLTTIDMNLRALGQQAGLMVLAMSRGELDTGAEHKIPCTLVVRQSCGGGKPVEGEEV